MIRAADRRLVSAETVSQISASEWDAVFGSDLKRKLHPGMSAQSGMNFPNGAADGNCVPDSTLRMGFVFRLKLQRKVHPRIQAQNGTRFPDGMLGGNYGPVSGSRTGCIFRSGPRAVGVPPLVRAPLVELRYS